MKNFPVHWYEGLFLRPQHFQATERWWSEQLACSQRWDNPYHYGLRRIAFNKEALRNHQFQVMELDARLPDGTLVSLDAEMDRVDLKKSAPEIFQTQADLTDAFDKTNVVRVYLAIPKIQFGRENVAGLEQRGSSWGGSVGNGGGNGAARSSAAAMMGTGNGGQGGVATLSPPSQAKPAGVNPNQVRYREVSREVHDENRSAADEEVRFRSLNICLLLSTQDLSGYELLPIAQIKRASEREAAPQIDDEYVPPVISLGAWPNLARDLVRPIYDIIGEKIEVLSEQLRNRGIARHSVDPADADRVAMLERLNEAYATLSIIAFTDGIHPLTAYTELCRIVGQLSIFGEQRRVHDLPPYDHEDLGNIFRVIRRQIESLIFSVRDYEYQQRFFVGVGMGMQVSLDPRWFNSNWQWFIGVKKGDLSEPECRALLSSGQLDWKLGSSRQVEILFQRRAQGLQLEPVQRTIRALPANNDWIYYSVSRNDSPAWRDVQETQSLAMRLKDSLIVNQDRLQGEQKLVVNMAGRNVGLQFALFAVPAER